MVWHYDIQWNFQIHIRPHFWGFDNLFIQTFADFRKIHLPIDNFTEIMFPVLGTDGYKYIPPL